MGARAGPLQGLQRPGKEGQQGVDDDPEVVRTASAPRIPLCQVSCTSCAFTADWKNVTYMLFKKRVRRTSV